ncbi:UvrD/REP helicase family protein [Trichomonas vaginalis G3]|uniref:DNA 3'-5' helicase n=1 Tax=Trichomonas vaginalis (strain ATCC PRA-98 / G3) TaxID=412133 RepID=A2F0U7_TRIV3|nr:ATP-dependent DNA helicase protein [Trichomonas vaginalis G3]EAY01482.1 UvrD/REP helicase family protein [Trichomonas vaginalis G3]KAI5523346.1 ATP-dependent DNA helicase protein [Trichomonas vaginalis G3]|eukprot:XP_001330278.1 UvrD/REP helicase family protein [Trichomonas vaginalis G3]
MSKFTEEQANAVNASIDHPIAIVACPGSGKTFTIIHRIAHLIESGIKPERLLVITFTRKAAQELRQRLTNMGLEVSKLTVSTFHSFGRTIVAKYGSLIGIQKFRLITENEQYQILSSYLPQPEIADRKQLLLALQLYKVTKKCESEELSSIFEKYIAELKSKELVDFTDLITYPLEILRNNQYALQYYQRRFEYCLVDEMQDVSQTQFDLIHTLFNSNGHITVVGDDDQTIYGWRGADSSLLLQFQEKFTNAETFTLSTCFRCPNFIIKAMSELIKNNKIRVKKSIKCSLNEPLGKNRIKILGALNQEREAVLVCNEIEKIKNKKPFETISVLFRTRKQSLKILEEMKNRRIQISKNKQKYEGQSFDLICNLLLLISERKFDEKIVNSEIIKKISATNQISEIVGRYKDMRIKSIIDDIADKLNLKDNLINDLISESEKPENLDLNPGDFADELKFNQNEIQENIDNVVQMTTVHQAKGLEWDNVFIIGLNSGNWPSNRSKDKEEKRRLFYVAMSRARKNLFMSFSQSSKPSPYLSEISDFYFDIFIEKEEENQMEKSDKSEVKSDKPIELPGFTSVRMMNSMKKDDKTENGQLKLDFVSAKQSVENQPKVFQDISIRSRPHLDLRIISPLSTNKEKKEENESKTEQIKPLEIKKVTGPLRLGVRMMRPGLSSGNSQQFKPPKMTQKN